MPPKQRTSRLSAINTENGQSLTKSSTRESANMTRLMLKKLTTPGIKAR